jgi:hypothetical protein
MRRQNPPQAHLDKAQEIEKYLSPSMTAAIYGICGISYAVLVSLIFAAFVYESILRPTPAVVTIFAVIAFIPAIFIFLAWFLRPNDPVSSYITGLVDLWRRPIGVTPDPCTFKITLMDGESLQIKLSFYYPSKDQTSRVKERIYTSIHGALTKDFYLGAKLPTGQEIESALDASLEMLAAECGIPVLYLEIENVDTSHQSSAAEAEYLRTGTWA